MRYRFNLYNKYLSNVNQGYDKHLNSDNVLKII